MDLMGAVPGGPVDPWGAAGGGGGGAAAAAASASAAASAAAAAAPASDPWQSYGKLHT